MTPFRRSGPRRWGLGLAVGSLLAAGIAAAPPAAALTPPTLGLKVLLVGEGATDPVTLAWAASLGSEGVPYTLVQASGTLGSQTVTLPGLSSGSTGSYNGVVLAGSPGDFASGALTSLDSYEAGFGVRQVDGYMYPSPALGLTDATGGALDGTTGTLTTAGLADFPSLKGPVPFDSGTYGYTATADPGAAVTPLLENSAGGIEAAVYQHPSSDAQANVSELSLLFNYNSNQLQWLLLAPGLIDWVTQDTHLGLYRNYFGQDVDDVFIADNEWSSQYQCTPAATDPNDVTCPTAVQGNPADGPPDTQMSAADVAYVANWEATSGIKLEFAFNAIGACTAPDTASESGADCTGSFTKNGETYTDPGQDTDTSYPNDAGMVNALISDQGDFNWITHTWSHMFLGCQVWAQPTLSSATASSGGSISAGGYHYEVTAATAYGESEPSAARPVTVSSSGKVSLTWPDATNGGGPSLATLEGEFGGGTGFWGYNVYRENPGSGSFGLIGQVAEDPTGATTAYGFTDTGATSPGATVPSSASYPTATDPGIECAGTGGADWLPADSTVPDSSIQQEIGLDDAFAQANGFTDFSGSSLVTGEHSGLENPNIPQAFADMGITVTAADASRQPTQYALTYTSGGTTSTTETAPRYPSNIYYNADNWPDELNEYNTLYVANGTSLGDSAHPSETGHCADTSSTTCISTAATESSLLATESHIMLGHILSNDPRVGYAHQSDLIGPATHTAGGVTSDYGYTLLSLLDAMQTQYGSWYTSAAPLDQTTDAIEAQVLGQQAAWAANLSAATVTASETGGVVTVSNSGGSAAGVPITVPAGTTVGGSAFGSAYGGQRSAWDALAAGGSATLTEHIAPAVLSANAATSIVGAAFSFTVATSGEVTPSLSESGSLPSGITFTDNGNGTATLAGTATSGSGGSYPITITAANSTGSVNQSFTLTNAEAPTVSSPSTTSFSTGVAGTYNITTTGFPAPGLSESGTLPGGLSFTDHGNGTGTIAGTPTSGSAGTYHVSVSATNVSGSTATLSLTITVGTSAAPTITSSASSFFWLNSAGGVGVTTTGSPTPAITESGTLPPGLTFVDNGNGTALVSGTPTATGTYTLTFTATNAVGSASQTYTLYVGSAPSFTNAASTGFSVGTHGSFTVTTSGYPAPWIGYTGALPTGVTFTNNGDGTATLVGTPTTAGTYTITLDADSDYGSASQSFTITVS